MKVTSEILLQILPEYMGSVEVVKEDQTVYDIIDAVDRCHKKYAPQYDLIAEYFIGKTPYDTCKNIFDFMRRSSFYYIEDELTQTLRSPSGILATGKTLGLDCKNYALMIGGILDAINRTGLQYIPFVYRFASDKPFDPLPNHVFIVAFPGTDEEIWIDPIPQVNYFDQRLTYYYFTDKNFSTMSLQVLSGVTDNKQKLGAIDPGIIANVFNVAKNLFTGGSAPNPNDWMGWTPGDAKWWTLHDGDSISNEGVNIISFIKAHGLKDIIDSDAYGVQRVTIQQIASKLQRGGWINEANLLMQSGTLPGAPSTGTGFNLGSNSSMLLIGGGILAVVLLAKKKRSVNGLSTNAALVIGSIAAFYLLTKKQATTPLDVQGDIVRELTLQMS